MAEAGHKRRDNLDDATTEPVYTGAPLPPYIFIIENLLYCCYRFAPGAAAAFLPPDVSAEATSTVILCIYRHGAGWALNDCSGGLLSVVVDGYPSPDTGEGAFIVGGFIEEPSATLLSRHYAPFGIGRSEVVINGHILTGRLWSEQGLVLELELEVTEAPATPMSTNDRYLGRDAAGELTTSIWSVTGLTYKTAFTAFRLGPAAPPVFKALAPVKLEWGNLVPSMLTNLSYPEPLLPASEAARAGLMQTFDGLQRGACLLAADGRILHRNAVAARMLAGHPALDRGRVTVAGPEQARLAEAMAAAARGSAAPITGQFVLPGTDAAPILIQIAPVDHALAGPGAVLALLDAPRAGGAPPQARVLQLLGLTRGEARIAAAVGAGLPPREAALRLGLTESTVRSSLKVIFDKLGVKRQAELVQIVARLEAR